MTKISDFDLLDFMPYLLNQAADATSRDFEQAYKTKYGMLRTEWRVLFHLGRYGAMTAKDICTRARIHKTKVSRAVHALEDKRFLSRTEMVDDRRHETLALTKSGRTVFASLQQEAQRFDAEMMASFTDTEKAQMRKFLIRIAKL
ncbi:MAG: MarR family winged helix-turn-helix transcriptional regulator [Paracoccaceae bacterium]